MRGAVDDGPSAGLGMAPAIGALGSGVGDGLAGRRVIPARYRRLAANQGEGGTMWNQRAVCSRCECELPWDGVRMRGAVFCCWGCAQGQACESGAKCGETGERLGGGTGHAYGAAPGAAEAFQEGFN